MHAIAIHLFRDTAKADRDATLLSIFFLVLPFIYVAQVLSGRPAVGVIGYLPLLLLSLAAIQQGREHLHGFLTPPRVLSFLLLALVAHNAVSGLEVLVTGNVALGGRVLCLFVLPFIAFVAGRRLSTEQHWRLMKIITFTAVVVAAELTWENVCNWLQVQPSWFQLLNRDYVLGQTGKDLTQLYHPGYRGTGLLEHVHVSVFYLAVGMVAGVTLYLHSGARRYLMAAGFCEAVLVVHGVRLALIAGIAALVLHLLLIGWNRRTERRDELKYSVLFLALVFILVLVADPFGTVRRFYIPVVMQGAWNLDRPDDITVGTVIRQGLENLGDTALSRLLSGVGSSDFYIGLFGHGIARSLRGNIAGLDDDFFVAQIFAQYGLLGGIVFYLTLLCSLLLGLRAAARSSDEQGLLLAFAVAVVFLMAISTLHSGVVQRKVPFALLFWVLAIVCAYSAERSIIADKMVGAVRR